MLLISIFAFIVIFLLIRNFSKSKNNKEKSLVLSDEYESDYFEDGYDSKYIDASFDIDYTDSNGLKTKRRVDVFEFFKKNSGEKLITGHCSLRDDVRSFRIDRISHCVDLETGEVIDDLFEFLDNKYNNSPERTVEKLLDSEKDVLAVLLFVGKSDGQFKAAEKKIFKDVCLSIGGDDRVTDKMIEYIIKNTRLLSLSAFKLAVGRIAKRNDETSEIVLKAAEDIVSTQKTIHPAEQDALDYVRKKLAVTTTP